MTDHSLNEKSRRLLERAALTATLALNRYEEHNCPVGNHKMEYRIRRFDYYCHSCKEKWTALKLSWLIDNHLGAQAEVKELSIKGNSSWLARLHIFGGR